MKLISLELENIKSYVSEKIDFKEGINCIIGLNGSGKSTIIEAIGYSLFNYNQTTSDNLIRYNESKGKISVVFESDEGYQYKIERTLRRKQNGSVKIIDLNTNEVLQENVSNVYKLVNKILKISQEKTLAKLFEEIIAVPQGTFVNAFLETPVKRQANFDKLFELDIYTHLADNMKKASDLCEKKYLFELEKEVSNLDGKLTDYNVKKDNLLQLENDITELNSNKTEKQAIYNKKEVERINLSKLKDEYDSLDKDLLNLNSNNKILTEKYNQVKNSLEKASDALDIVNKNQFGYNAYNFNLKKLEENRKVLIKVNNNKQILSNNKIKIEKNQDQIKDLENIISEYKKDIGDRKQKIIDTNNNISNYNKELEKNSLELEPLKKSNVIKNSEYQAKKNLITKRYNYLFNYYESMKNFDMTKTVEEYDSSLNKLEEQLKEIGDYKQKIIELDKEKVKINQDVENLRNNEAFMSSGLCPILKEPCKNIKEGSLSCEVTNLIKKGEDDILKITLEITSLTKLITNEDDLNKEYQSQQILKNNCIEEKKKYLNTIDLVKKEFSDEEIDITYENSLDVVKKLYNKYLDLQENYEDTELNISKQREVELNTLINNTSYQIKLLRSNINTYENDIEGINQKINDNLDKINKIKSDIAGLDTENNSITLDLIKYQNIDIDIKDGEESVKKFTKNYEAYIQNIDESKKIKEYETNLKEREDFLNSNNKTILETTNKLEEIKTKYSYEELDKLIKAQDNLRDELNILSTKIEYKTNELSNLKETLKELDNIKLEKEEKEKNITKYNNINDKLKMYRVVYTNLPRVLSEKIRLYIGDYASGIYRTISKEDVNIKILSNYEVQIIDCVDPTKIKSLSQLSGGEQMSVAISIRLAMLKHIANINLYFMDEPTVNLDKDRRLEIAEVVKDVSHNLSQLFVISHDDTFENITDSAINISKIGNISHIDR